MNTQLSRKKLGTLNPQYKHGLEKFRSYKWLYQKYVIEELSLTQIASIVGVNFNCIRKWLIKVSIPRRNNGARIGQHNHHFKGRTVNSQGYILIYSPDHPHKDKRNYMREHILVAEQILDRLLFQDECIHHIDENKRNNHPSNLYLFPRHNLHDQYHQRKRKHSKLFIPIIESNLSMNG